MEGTELENLVIRLTGDATHYMKELDSAVKHTEEAAKHVEHAAHEIEGFHHKLGEFAEGAEKKLFKLGLIIGAWEAFEKADHAEATMRHLEAAIESNDGAVKETIASYKKFSKEISDTTALSKGETIALLAKAEAYGMTGDAAKKAAKDAIALSNLPGNEGSGPEGYLKVTQAMAKGNVELAMTMSQRLIPQLRGVKDEAEFTARYMKMLDLGMNIAKGDVEDATGQLEKMKQSLGGLTKEIGENIKPGIDLVIETVSGLTKVMTENGSTVRFLVASTLTLIAATALLATTWGSVTLVGGRLVTIFVTMTSAQTYATAAMWLYNASVTNAVAVTRLLTTGLVVGLVAGIGYAVYSLIGGKKAAKEFNEELEKTNELTNKLLKSNEKHVESMGGEDLEKQAAQQSEALAKAKKAAEEFRSWKNNGVLGYLGKQVAGGSEQEKLDQKVKESQAYYDQTKQQMEKNRAAADREARKGTEATEEMVRELERAITTMGMTEAEVKAWDLALKGATEDQLALVRSLQYEKEAMEEAIKAEKAAADAKAKLEDSYQDTVSKLDMEINKLEMTTDAYERLRLAMEGFSEDQIDVIRTKQMYLEQLEDENKVQEENNALVREASNQSAVAVGSAEALSRIMAYQDSLNGGSIRGNDGASANGRLGKSSGPGGGGNGSSRNDELLAQIRDRLDKLVEKPDLVMVGANLGGA